MPLRQPSVHLVPAAQLHLLLLSRDCCPLRRLAVRKPYIVKDISQIGVKVNEYKYRS